MYKKYPISSLVEHIIDNRGKTPPLEEDGIPLIQSFMLGKKNRFPALSESTKFVSTETFDSWFRSGHPKKGDLLIAVNGSIGEVSTVDDKKYTVAQDIIGLRFDKRLCNPIYMYYFFTSPFMKQVFLKLNNGATRPSIRVPHLLSYEISIRTDLKKQKKIADILSSIDDKIELNNKINKNLEELAQTLYKRWFVDFEFPNEEGLPYQSCGGEMVESELGLIPKGWEYKPIQSIVDTVLGGTPSRKINDYWGPGYEWLKSGELNNFRIIKGTETITQKGLDSSATKLMPKGTVLIGITGYVGLVSMLEIEACANQSVVGIIPNNLFPRTFLYGLIKSEIGDIASKQTGSAQQHINKNDINTHRVLIPTNQLITKFHSILEPIHQKISNNIFANEKLSIIRDELLPKLMSGEIEVPAGEDNVA